MKQTFETIQKKLSDAEWCATQEPDFIEVLKRIESTISNLSAQIFVFIDLFDQYCAAMYNSPVFAAQGAEPDTQNDKVSTGPTQTNRAARRAKPRA